jgi:uncharacterized membrane protein
MKVEKQRMTLPYLILIVSGTLTGLLAGLLFAFSIAVIPGLRDLEAKSHIAAMQRINIRIINPLFMFSFLGPTVLLPLAAFLYREGTSFPMLLTAAALHMIGVNGVTIVGNVPLNDRLAEVSVDTLTDVEAEQVRQDYHGQDSSWMRMHHVRTLAAVAAAALVFLACLADYVLS